MTTTRHGRPASMLISIVTAMVLSAGCHGADEGRAPQSAARQGEARATPSDGTAESGAASAAPAAPATSAENAPSEPAPPASEGAAVPAIPGANVVTYVATDYGFEGPAKIPAGLTTLRLINRGGELHHLMLVRLRAGKTSADYVKAMSGRGPEASLPEWAAPEGGPNAIVPGEESNATALLEPGTYAFTCWIPSPDGVIHGTKGMTTTVEVTPTSAKAAPPEPEGDIEVELVDYAFQVTGRVAPGPHVLAIENEGTEPHELSLWRLAPGKSLADLVAWAEAGMAGEPPGKPIGGVAPMKPGDRELFGVNLEPGEYALLCFVPDDEDGRPHIQHGMAKQFTVG